MNFNARFAPENADSLAKRIIELSRKRITQESPILLAAVYALEPRVRETSGEISTDGAYLWYHPEQVVKDFRKKRDSITEQVLHVTLHCLLGHLKQRGGYENKALFDVIADSKVAQLTYHVFHSFGLHWMWDIPSWFECDEHTLPSLYASYVGSRNRSRLIKELATSSLRIDDHRLWTPEKPTEITVGAAIGAGSKANTPDWDGLLRRLIAEAERSPRWGSLAGELKREFEPSEENGVSYASFLRRFAAPRERLLLDHDSFDPRWYHIGLEQYGDIPILEPSELSEPPLADDIVIAIDTSGSCSGDVCRRFLRETLNLLRDISAGASTFRVTLMQCDAEVQKELILEHEDDVDDLAEDFEPEGFGGTDFRPVFERIEERRADGSLPRVRGLLYLSDGEGDFPKTAPDYPVAFLIPKDEDRWRELQIPDWITVLQLNTDDFTVKEAE